MKFNLELIKEKINGGQDNINILDIGAHIGSFYKEAKLVWPSSYIFCVEANKNCHKYLEDIGAPHITAVLSNIAQEVSYYQSKISPIAMGNSVYREKTKFYDTQLLEVEKRWAITLDSLLANMFSPNFHFDLIKIDTQGSELDIIKGGHETIKKCQGLILEISIEEYNEGAPLKYEVEKYLTDVFNCNLNNYIVLGENKHPITGHIIQYDIFYPIH